MNCAFDKEKLTAFYDGELDAAGKTEVERHISSCSECLRDLGEIKSASLLVKELPRPRAPRSLAEGVSREIAATGRVHSFSKARSMVLWATAAAAGLFIVANVIFLSGPAPEAPGRPEPGLSAIAPAAEDAKKAAKLDAGMKEEKQVAGNREADRPSFGRKDAGALKDKEADSKELGEARKAEDPKAGADAKPKEFAKAAEPAKPAPAAKPAAPPAPSAPPASAAPAPEPRPALAERAPSIAPPGAIVLNVTSSEMAKVRPRVEDIVRKYADRANADRARQLEQQASNELKKAVEEKAATKRREAESQTGTITLDLTPSEYEALKKEIEQVAGSQLAWAGSDGRLRGAPGNLAGKGGAAPEAEGNALTGGGQAGGLKAPAAPNADSLQRKAADEALAKKDQQQQQTPAAQQTPVAKQTPSAPVESRDKNAQEEPRRIQAGETRIRIVINFLDVPVVEKK